jgi:hypothetical protein
MSLTKSAFVRAQAVLDGLLERNRRFCRDRRMSRTKSSLFRARAYARAHVRVFCFFLDRSPLMVDLCSIRARRMSRTKSLLYKKSSDVLNEIVAFPCSRRARRMSRTKSGLSQKSSDLPHEIVAFPCSGCARAYAHARVYTFFPQACRDGFFKLFAQAYGTGNVREIAPDRSVVRWCSIRARRMFRTRSTLLQKSSDVPDEIILCHCS